jgi:DNA replication and repair protein RecF
MTGHPAVRLARLAVTGFRNLGDQELEPHPRFTLIRGANGQGKTNLIEAAHYALTLRMLRQGKLRELITHSAASASVRVRVALEGIETRLAVGLAANGGPAARELRREQTPASVDEYLLAGAVVAFTPDDLALIRGGPDRRRRMIDRAIFNRWPAYLGEARTYQRLLKSRNQLLRQRAAGEVRESFEAQLWASGARVLVRRRDLVREISPFVVDAFERIGLGHGTVKIQYRSFENGAEADLDEAQLAAALQEEAQERLAVDQERGFTALGPHADDVQFTLAGRSARSFASQGQARALILAVKVAEIENLRACLGHAPLLLLDDVSSELDPARNASLLAYLRGLPSQVLLTTTDDAPLRASVGSESARWLVTQGIVKIE